MEAAIKERKAPKKYDPEFRRSVIEHWVGSGKTAAAVAKEFGVNTWNMRDWKRQYQPVLKAPGSGQPETIEALRMENQQLRQQLIRTTSQREILKKTLAIISEQQG